jgi:hypothetical protein
MTLPTLVAEFAPTTNPGATPTYTSIPTSKIRELAITRGRQRTLERFEAGTSVAIIDNRARTYDPNYTSGTYFGNLLPMRKVRYSAVYNSVTYRLFTGFADGWPQAYQVKNDADVVLGATDGFEALALAKLTGTYAPERSGARIGNVLDDVGWLAADRDIDTGFSILQAADLVKVPALEHLQLVAETENGWLFVKADGALAFIDRQAPYSSSSVATFGDSGSELRYLNTVITQDKTLIFNDVQVTRESGETQTRTDSTSQARYFLRTLERSGQLQVLDTEANDAAAFLLATHKDPALQIEQLELNGERDPTNLWPILLGAELGNRYTVRRRPPGGGNIIEQSCFLQGIEHAYRPGFWEIRWYLTGLGAGYSLGTPIKLNDSATATLGSSGTTGVLTY